MAIFSNEIQIEHKQQNLFDYLHKKYPQLIIEEGFLQIYMSDFEKMKGDLK